VFAAVVLFFAARSLIGQWDKVGSRLTHIQFQWTWILAATALVFGAYALLIEGWRRVLDAWDSHLPFSDAARIWFLSNLAKYVPGNIWSLTTMGVMARRRAYREWQQPVPRSSCKQSVWQPERRSCSSPAPSCWVNRCWSV
jgi:glycosyltransferase 2 family protein